MTKPDLFLFAGEPSGDLHGEEILKALLEKDPSLKIIGVGGPKMRQFPFETILQMEEFQVMGFVDVFLSLPKLIRQFHLVKRTILERNPKKVVLIDYPGFNLRLARSLRKSGFKGKICHFICPSVWAWGKKRIPLMAQNLDMLLSILPFEKEIFAHTSLPVHYVGNPLVGHIESHPPSPLTELGNAQILGIFPGSRTQEIERNLKKQLHCARRLLTLDPKLKIALSVSHPKFCTRIQQICSEIGIAPQFIPHAYTYDLMSRCHLALATSGTVTLELALHHVPTVVTYGISSLDLIIAKHILHIILPFYCLVNIIANKEVFPELIGPNLTDNALFEKASLFLSNPSTRETCKKACADIQELLTHKNAAKEAAEEILAL